MAAALTVSTVQSSRASSCPEDDVHADPARAGDGPGALTFVDAGSAPS